MMVSECSVSQPRVPGIGNNHRHISSVSFNRLSDGQRSRDSVIFIVTIAGWTVKGSTAGGRYFCILPNVQTVYGAD